MITIVYSALLVDQFKKDKRFLFCDREKMNAKEFVGQLALMSDIGFQMVVSYDKEVLAELEARDLYMLKIYPAFSYLEEWFRLSKMTIKTALVDLNNLTANYHKGMDLIIDHNNPMTDICDKAYTLIEASGCDLYHDSTSHLLVAITEDYEEGTLKTKNLIQLSYDRREKEYFIYLKELKDKTQEERIDIWCRLANMLDSWYDTTDNYIFDEELDGLKVDYLTDCDEMFDYNPFSAKSVYQLITNFKVYVNGLKEVLINRL